MSALGSSQVKHYEENGFLVVDPIIADHNAEELCQEYDRLWETRGDRGSRLAHGTMGTRKAPIWRIFNLYEASSAFRALATNQILIDMVGSLIGERTVRVYQEQVQYKPPRIGGENRWHYDHPSFALIPPVPALTAWIALDTVTVENGCPWVVPGPHRFGPVPDIAPAWGLSHLPGVYLGQEIRPTACPMERGQVEFHNIYTWHKSRGNRTDKGRHGYAIHFIGDSARHSADGPMAIKGLPYGAPMDGVARLKLEVSAES